MRFLYLLKSFHTNLSNKNNMKTFQGYEENCEKMSSDLNARMEKEHDKYFSFLTFGF